MRLLSAGLVVLLAAAVTGCGQILQVSPQVSATSGKFSGDDISSGTKIGFGAGGKVRVGSPVYVDGGVFWSKTGGDIDDGVDSDEVAINTLRFPVTIGYHLLPLPIFDVRVFAGGAYSVVTSIDDNDFGLVKDDVKSSWFAGRAGAGVDVAILALDLAYEFGLGDVFEPSAGIGDVKQSQWVAEIGLRFGI